MAGEHIVFFRVLFTTTFSTLAANSLLIQLEECDPENSLDSRAHLVTLELQF